MQQAPYVIMFGGIALLLVVPLLYRMRRWASLADAGVEELADLGYEIGDRAGRKLKRRTPGSNAMNLIMIVVISLAVLGPDLYVLAVRGDDPLWATSAVSTILGYWLRAGTHG